MMPSHTYHTVALGWQGQVGLSIAMKVHSMYRTTTGQDWQVVGGTPLYTIYNHWRWYVELEKIECQIVNKLHWGTTTSQFHSCQYTHHTDDEALLPMPHVSSSCMVACFDEWQDVVKDFLKVKEVHGIADIDKLCGHLFCTTILLALALSIMLA